MGGTICVCRKEDQVGKSLLWLPYWIVNKMLDSVVSAEAKLGQPPSIIEIFCEMKHRYTLPVNNIFEGAAVINSLFREDLLFTNENASHWSVTRHPGWKSYSEIFRKYYGDGYACLKDGSVGVTTAKTLKLANLMQVLKSKDEKLFQQSKWIWDGDFKFLDGQDISTKIAFNTFPRSGNSFLRRLLE